MKLTVLGAGPAYTDRRGSTGAAYLIEDGGDSVLLDLGQGSFPALASTLEPSRLGAVAISHLHPDHFIDLVPLRHYLRYQLEPARRVVVHAPRGLAGRIDALHDEDGFTAAALDMTDLRDMQAFAVGGLRVEPRRVTHTADSYAFRVTRDGSADEAAIVYSGDCGRAEDLVPVVHPGDTLLIEVAFGPGPVSPGAQHLDAPAVARLAAATNPGRVLLTHIQMGFDPGATVEAVRRGWDGPVEMVDPGFTTQIAR